MTLHDCEPSSMCTCVGDPVHSNTLEHCTSLLGPGLAEFTLLRECYIRPSLQAERPSRHAREMVRFDPIQPCAARAARPTARPHGRCQPMADHGAERASSAAGSSRKPTNDAGARKNASSSKVCAAGWHQAAAQGMAGGCGIVSSALAAVSQPLCWIFGVHCIKHAVRLRCSCLWSTSRCAPQRRTLELDQGADGSGTGPVDVLNEAVAAGGRN